MLFSILLNAETIELGTTIPDVSVKNQDGVETSLTAVAEDSEYVLVYFYPKADTPGCTKQGCSLRDHYAKLTDQNITVLGVSTDKVAKQKAFAKKHRLPFTLLADTESKVIKAFGVPTIPGAGFAKRQAYLFKNSALIWKDEKAATAKQAQEVLMVLKK